MIAKLGPMLHGALWATSWIAALFFVRFWRASRERLFAFFAASFALLGCNWASLVLIDWIPEDRHHAHVLRLLAFVLLLVGIADKNRRAVVKGTAGR